ncbi:hypothetical protein [Phenylobacterium sp.]|jgi:hypothetical protein|uniref:hypothetical protein n=1 Tax=Phenylobacterium sp. TaxID=1871053 RepID=UPI002F9575A8
MRDGHIESAREFFAPDDEAAIARGEELREGRAAELWIRSAVVKRFPAKQDA